MPSQTALRHYQRPSERMLRVLRLLLLTGFMAACVGAQADSRPVTGWSSVIARLDGPLTPSRARQVRALGGYVYRDLPLIQSAAVCLPRRNVPRFSALPFVRHLSPDASVRKSDEFTVGATGAGQAFSQQGLTGAGVGVAVLDSGVRATPVDLADPASGSSRVLASVNFASDADTVDDLCGHGTHVAGILAGNGQASTGPSYTQTFYGIARGAGIVSVRVLDAQGRGAVSDVVKGIAWVIANKAQYHIRVLNLSLGHPVGESYTTDPLCQSVEAAWKAGLVVVCAAGNSGRLNSQPTLRSALLGDNEGYGTAYGSIQSPGDDPDVITVGALKQTIEDVRIATYSSRGPTRLDLILKPDITAPGNQIVSLNAPGSYLSTTYGATNGVPLEDYALTGGTQASPDYFVLSGTSMAAPVVSGAAALMLQADPTLTPDTVKARLMISADRQGSRSDDPCTYGAGTLDIPAALQCRRTAAGPALSPALWRDPFGFVHLDVDGLAGPDGSLWGTGLLRSGGVWGSQMIWGESVLSGSQMIWGESVWNDQMIWGESVSGADLSGTALGGE